MTSSRLMEEATMTLRMASAEAGLARGSLLAGLVREGDAPADLELAPQRGVSKHLLNHAPVICLFPGGDQARGQAGVISQGFEDRAVEVSVGAPDLAIVLPLELQLSKFVPTPNDLTVEDKGQ
jgi:hypothetical protein